MYCGTSGGGETEAEAWDNATATATTAASFSLEVLVALVALVARVFRVPEVALAFRGGIVVDIPILSSIRVWFYAIIDSQLKQNYSLITREE